MYISPFSPIYFSGPDCKVGSMKDYVHTFSTSDHILIEIFHPIAETIPTLWLLDAVSGESISSLGWNIIRLNVSDGMSFYELRELKEGYYVLKFGEYKSNLIHITEDSEVLNDTVLIQYATLDNRSRKDILSWINGKCYYHDFRVFGGFLDSDWIFHVENEQFMTENNDVVELCAFDYTEKTLTVGPSSGLPFWIGEMLNRIFSCSLTFIDGKRYSRPQGSPLSHEYVNDDGKGFVFRQLLRESNFLNAEFEYMIRLSLRRNPLGFRRSNNSLRRI